MRAPEGETPPKNATRASPTRAQNKETRKDRGFGPQGVKKGTVHPSARNRPIANQMEQSKETHADYLTTKATPFVAYASKMTMKVWHPNAGVFTLTDDIKRAVRDLALKIDKGDCGESEEAKAIGAFIEQFVMPYVDGEDGAHDALVAAFEFVKMRKQEAKDAAAAGGEDTWESSYQAAGANGSPWKP